jgi:hypothetical protein
MSEPAAFRENRSSPELLEDDLGFQESALGNVEPRPTDQEPQPFLVLTTLRLEASIEFCLAVAVALTATDPIPQGVSLFA